MNKKINTILIVLLAIILVASSTYLILQNKEDEKQETIFEELSNIVTEENEENVENEKNEEKYEIKANTIKEEKKIDINQLHQKNNDFVGWLKIDNTSINYPVMQTEMERKDYYLRKNFYKEYSQWGTPYIAEYCNILSSDNTIIYGHHINGNKMFGEFEKYKSKEFYNAHKNISFNTIYGKFNYEIIAVFKTSTDNGFKYYNFEKAKTKEEYKEFIDKCKEISLYNIDTTAEYGEKLITLSTCDYSEQNGRFVVIAKKR
ncbi:MAG: class B sortase [Clostridia bacterium]|nr:class B sortase [Clostridia bacterium]